ncbi:MAG TPA: class II aldolase/adducin family protein [Firmicutes bacterium]|nr:class II aldolase/adducin family protein [Bacillota bacterium]HHY97530.1 class II aldolase/adducin family protein [Bacillota bacterium]
MLNIEQQLRKEIVDAGRWIYERGYVAANDGNISARLPDGSILMTPTGVSKGRMTPDMLVKVDAQGNPIEGYLKPSSEVKMHLAVYRKRPDVGAVAHAHPLVATAFAVAGISLDRCILPEVIISLGWIPLARYATPSTDELAHSVEEFIEYHDAVLLQNHGVLTMAEDVTHAMYKMETVEHFARISFYARLLGGENELSSEDVAKLISLRKKMRIPGRYPNLGMRPSSHPDRLTGTAGK